MPVVSVKTQRRFHDGDGKHYDGHREAAEDFDFDFWCIAHGERKGCHDGMSDGSCSPDCPDCPVPCPWCAKVASDA